MAPVRIGLGDVNLNLAPDSTLGQQCGPGEGISALSSSACGLERRCCKP